MTNDWGPQTTASGCVAPAVALFLTTWTRVVSHNALTAWLDPQSGNKDIDPLPTFWLMATNVSLMCYSCVVDDRWMFYSSLIGCMLSSSVFLCAMRLSHPRFFSRARGIAVAYFGLVAMLAQHADEPLYGYRVAYMRHVWGAFSFITTLIFSVIPLATVWDVVMASERPGTLESFATPTMELLQCVLWIVYALSRDDCYTILIYSHYAIFSVLQFGMHIYARLIMTHKVEARSPQAGLVNPVACIPSNHLHVHDSVQSHRSEGKDWKSC